MTRSGRWLLLSLVVGLACGCASIPDFTSVGFPVMYDGATSFPAFRLRRVIEDLLRDFGKDHENEASILDAAQDLMDFYNDEGFPDASVDYEIETDPVAVVFKIHEGPRVTMASPEISGNLHISTAELLPLWNRRTSGILGMGDPYFVLSDLEGFGVAIRERYLTRGFLGVDVLGPTVQREEGSDAAAVSFKIIEGPRYQLTEMVVAPELRAVGVGDVGAEFVGEPYAIDSLQTARLRARDALRNQGYHNPRVRATVDIDRVSHTVRASISGDPRDRVRVVGYTVTGLQRTVKSVVDGQIEFVIGDWYSGKAVDDTVRELYLTGVFETVQIKSREVADGEVVLDIEVEEVETREVSFLVGWGSYELLRGGVFYTDRNLFGYGHTLRIATRASVRSYGGDITWTEPSLFDSDTSLSATTFYRLREEPAFTDTSFGLSTALSRRLFRDAQARVGYSLQQRDGSDIPVTLVPADNSYLSSPLFAEFTYDKRNSVLFPESGHRETAKVEYASEAFGGDVNFVRATGRLEFFMPLADRVTLAFRGETGLVWWLDDDAVPVQERFYNGGFNTVRSFRQAQLGPRTISGEPAGGEFRNVFNAELRFPIAGALAGAAFLDAGNVGRRVDSYGLSNLRYGIGAGLRWNLPIGPVRIDGAVNPDPKASEDRYAIHFSIGFPF